MASDGSREFVFRQADFEIIRKLIYEHAGISLGPQKFDMVYSRIARRLRVLGLASFADYLALLRSDDQAEWQDFINALTTNLTSFFRENHHFDILADYLREIGNERRVITLWCAAASTGEEPYSMAITACETFGRLDPPVRILASDVDTNVLARGQEGIYTMERLERVPRAILQNYFLKGRGNQDNRARARRELRQLITFRQINLLDNSWPLRGPIDAIFCRNVMIYFDKKTQYSILQKFMPLLRPDGLLFAGHSESFAHAADLFRPLGRTVYVPASSGRRTQIR